MRQSLDFTKHTLKTYYNIVKAYEEEVKNQRTWLLDYLYEEALLEFEDDPIHHSAMEYNSYEANSIIALAEKLEDIVNTYFESDYEWNMFFEKCQK